MRLLAFGLNHQSAPVGVREQIAFPVETLSGALQDIKGRKLASEVAIISTCNRTECYCVVANSSDNTIVDWLGQHHRLPMQDIRPYLYVFEDLATVRHLFRVS